jgi:hypothetical protein
MFNVNDPAESNSNVSTFKSKKRRVFFYKYASFNEGPKGVEFV